MQEQATILKGNLNHVFWRLALPLFLLNLMNSLYNVIDTFWVGQIGELQVGAVSLVGPIMWCAQAVAGGLSAAAIAIIATKLGEGNSSNASRFATALIYFAIGFGLILTIITITCIHPILSWLDTPAEIYNDSYQYLLGISFDYIGLMLMNLYMAIRQSAGDSKSGVKINTAASLLNVVLDPLLIFGLHLGVLGAAIATVLSKVIVLPVVFRLLHKREYGVYVSFHEFPFQIQDGKQILKLCIPAASGQFLESLGFVIMNKYIVFYGAVAISAYGVGGKLANLTGIPMIAFSSILATFIAQNLGAGNIIRARKSYLTAMKFCTISSTLLTIIGMLIITPFIYLFVPDASETLVNMAREYTFFALLCGVFMGWYSNLCGAFNGSGHTSYTFFLSMLRLWGFRIPLILLFHNFTDLGITGIWIAMLLSNIMECALGQWIYMRHRWETSTIITTK